jgi:SAM-dependent methyltransferase
MPEHTFFMSETYLHGRDWEELARLDPLWAILSDSDKRFGRWNLDDFLRTGDEEISTLMASASQIGVPRQFRRAIDFGCGVGRLTRVLSRHFTECHGVDISRSMVEMATRMTPECDFRHGSDLKSFPNGCADLIYSNLVLQHQPDRNCAVSLIGDMMRVLAPEGLLAFQIPLHLPLRNRLQPRRRAYRVLRALGLPESLIYKKLKLSPMRMLWLPRADVEDEVQCLGGEILKVDETLADRDPFTNGMFYCTKTR